MHCSLKHVEIPHSKRPLEKPSVLRGLDAQDIKWKQCPNVGGVPIRILNGICQQAVLCCLDVQKSPHSRKLGVKEETKGSVRSDICYPHCSQCSQFDQYS